MNVGIIGYGIVGSALGELLKKKHKVFAFDLNKALHARQDVYDNCRYLFFCVPTPQLKTGGLDMSIMDEAIDHAAAVCKDKFFVLRSTVRVGYTEGRQAKDKNNRYIFNPEFLVERRAKECTANPELLIAGAASRELVISLQKDVYSPLKQVLTVLSTKEAEFAKIASNALLASQVTAANECFKISCAENVNWTTVATVLKRLRVIGNNIDVPGPDGMCGYGGKCLPKDINELCEMYRRRGFTSYFFEEAQRMNTNNRAMAIRRTNA